MEIIKICMECGNEFEDDIHCEGSLYCPRCGSGDVYQPEELEYDALTLEDLFIIYHKNKLACECDGDSKEICFMEE